MRGAEAPERATRVTQVSTPPPASTVLRRAALAATGGAVGTAARLGLGMLITGAPSAVLTVNIVGALLLGVLTARLPSGDLRILLGTGLLGGFTTYSAFAVDGVELWEASPLLAVGYIAVSLAGGLLAAWLGLRLGGALGRRSAS
ncbi:CrcB family protein [Microbacterium esteraromaticum]|uniref:Fluoride-specific ion channel FluC n=1 Tax=Microbacterium esteraromaticum TaxID=57043 RepID=A0A7D7WEY2_9MICO|nr:CrcB family protein [Microbacterium esteraromaticum]